MQILSVTPLDKRRSKVLTDEDFAFALYRGELKHYDIEVGRELPGEVYGEILEKILFARAKERTLYLLKSRDRTETEIRQKLKDGYYPPEAIEYAVEFLKEYRFVDDDKYARSYIRAYSTKRSKRQLEFELINKGIDRETVRGLLEECPVMEEDQIRRYLKAKGYRKGETPLAQQAKMAAALARKGFSYETVRQVMDEE